MNRLKKLKLGCFFLLFTQNKMTYLVGNNPRQEIFNKKKKTKKKNH